MFNFNFRAFLRILFSEGDQKIFNKSKKFFRNFFANEKISSTFAPSNNDKRSY